MTQDNIQKDTPQESTNEQQYTSLEEAVFGTEGSNDTSSAFTSGEEGTVAPAPEGQPGAHNEGDTTNTNNDDTRYQYWQSQADKYKNELESIKQQQPQAVAQAPQQVVQPELEPVDEFPPAPDKPQRPRTFSREEAYSDPSSDSARFMDELDDWRDNMNEYNNLKNQYQTAVMEDKFHQIEAERVENIKRAQAHQQQAAQEMQVKERLTGHYGMNDNEAVDFMTKMSDPNSINIDNLVQLYRMNNGNANQQQPTNAVPSDAFTQTKNAQQVPSPMGVMPSGQNNQDSRSMEDKIMDTMIGNFDSKNPWK